MTVHLSAAWERRSAQIAFVTKTLNPMTLNPEIMKDMSKNRKGAMLVVIAVILFID